MTSFIVALPGTTVFADVFVYELVLVMGLPGDTVIVLPKASPEVEANANATHADVSLFTVDLERDSGRKIT